MIAWEMKLKELWAQYSVKAMTLSIVTGGLSAAMMLWQPETLQYAVWYVMGREALTVVTIILRNIKQ